MPNRNLLTALAPALAALPLLAAGGCATTADDGALTSGSAATEARSRRGSGEALDPGDVTVLWPLPAPAAVDDLLRRDASLGKDSTLLPDALAAHVGQLVEHFTAEETRDELRVVCARFDPCARTARTGPDACVGQMRFVLQPLTSVDGSVVARDAAVHVFYELSAPETVRLASALGSLHEAREAGPFGSAHARLAAGDEGYRSGIRALVADFGSKASLSRVTFMRNVDVKGNTWVFGGVDVDARGRVTPLVVPRVTGAEQRVVVHGSFPFSFSLSPAPSGDDTLGLLLDPTRLGVLSDANPDAARQRIQTGFDAAVALENPSIHDATTADCASCHVVGAARSFAERAAKDRAIGLSSARRYAGEPTSSVTPGSAAEALRACGYVGRVPTLSVRTRNESVVAAAKMEELRR